MKLNFIDTDHCRSKALCTPCRGNADFRRDLARIFNVPPDFDTCCALESTASRSTPAQPEKPLPPMPVRLSNFGRAILTVAKEALETGEPLVDKRTFTQRLAVCFSCPGKNFRPSDGTCALCGCFMKVKAWLAAMKCDADYWGKPGPLPVKRMPRVTMPVTIGQRIIEHELDVRALLPAEGLTAAAINAYHARVNGPTKCGACLRGKLYRAIADAYKKEEAALDADTRNRLAVLISGAPVVDATP